jgi:hypothetical protein
MKSQGIQTFLSRWLLALTLVFGAYNARGLSFYHLVKGEIDTHQSVVVLAGLALAILLTICLRATVKSISFIGMIAAALFVAAVIWVMSDYELLEVSNQDYLIYFAQIVLATVIAIGMSWGELRDRN